MIRFLLVVAVMTEIAQSVNKKNPVSLFGGTGFER
jgi:hypothetical protein